MLQKQQRQKFQSQQKKDEKKSAKTETVVYNGFADGTALKFRKKMEVLK